MRLVAHYILVTAKYRSHTSHLEGARNKIKVIKRMASVTTAHFFLKIKVAFPVKNTMHKKKGR